MIVLQEREIENECANMRERRGKPYGRTLRTCVREGFLIRQVDSRTIARTSVIGEA